MTLNWDPAFADRSPIFGPLRGAATGLCPPQWPGCGDLNCRLAAQAPGIVTGGGKPLRFVAQAARQQTFEDKFEPRAFLRGEVQFRPCNWHDFFNALVWLTFPCAKAALNARHFDELTRQRARGAPNRGPAQDALSLFDEGGIIVASAEPALAALLAGHAWKTLFWRQRAAVAAKMRFYVFGHALYEKALAPFTGVTGRGLIVDVADGFFAMTPARQLVELDARIAARIRDPACFLGTPELTPVPVLGVPGWCADNEREDYYDNAGYFRPARNAASGVAA